MVVFFLDQGGFFTFSINFSRSNRSFLKDPRGAFKANLIFFAILVLFDDHGNFSKSGTFIMTFLSMPA